jgi:hypothetical protein
LPPRGEAAVANLTDGAPVFVVHHHDGTVSALDPRAAQGDSTQLQLVRWTAATRHFLGGGAWDEYGRRLDGFRSTDLLGFATRVTGDVVEIGASVDPPAGSPITATTDPPAMADLTAGPSVTIDLPGALRLAAGSTAWIDADVVIDPDGAHVCHAQTFQGSIELDPCPPDSPVVDDLVATPGSRSIWFGPLLITRTSTGFEHVTAIGGVAATAL